MTEDTTSSISPCNELCNCFSFKKVQSGHLLDSHKLKHNCCQTSIFGLNCTTHSSIHSRLPLLWCFLPLGNMVKLFSNVTLQHFFPEHVVPQKPQKTGIKKGVIKRPDIYTVKYFLLPRYTTKRKNSTEDAAVLQGKTNPLILKIFPSAEVIAGDVNYYQNARAILHVLMERFNVLY